MALLCLSKDILELSNPDNICKSAAIETHNCRKFQKKSCDILPDPVYFNMSKSSLIRCGKKRWQEYTEELYKKDLHDPDNHDGVITDVEPDILECEVKWALESITTNKASGSDGIQLSYFKS